MLPNKFIIEEARGSLRTPFFFFQVLTKAYAIFGALAKYVSYLFPKFIFFYYSTIASFYHIWSRERAKYETVIHCSVPV